MVDHDPKLPAELDILAVADGFDPNALIVPSAAGMPLATGLSPQQSLEHSKAVFEAAERGLRGGIKISR